MRKEEKNQYIGCVSRSFQVASADVEKVRKQYPPPISLRLTPDERSELENAAHGMTMSAYIRRCIFGEKAKPRKVRSRAPVKDHRMLASLLGLLGQSRIANNLNQLARDANCGSLLLDQETQAKIDEAYEAVVQMRDTLIAALGLIENDQR